MSCRLVQNNGNLVNFLMAIATRPSYVGIFPSLFEIWTDLDRVQGNTFGGLLPGWCQESRFLGRTPSPRGCSALKQEMRSRWRIRDLASYIYIYSYIGSNQLGEHSPLTNQWKNHPESKIALNYSNYASVTLLILHDHKHLLWVMFSKIEQITRKSSSLCSSLRFFRSSSFSLSFSSNSSWLSSKCFHQFSSDQVNANIPRNVQTSSTWTRYWLFSKNFERLLWSLTWLECLSIWTRRFGIFPCFSIIAMNTIILATTLLKEAQKSL